MGCNTLGSAALAVVVDHLGAELVFMVAVGLECSGFLVAGDVVDVGFLGAAAEGGRLASGAKRKTKTH